MKKNFIRSLLCLLTLASAMSGMQDKKQDSSAQEASHDAAKQSRKDPCALLTTADVQAVQGDSVQETKPSTQPGGGLVMLQCLFRTAMPSKSVSLAIASRSSISPRTFWQNQFHSGNPASTEKEKTEKKPLVAHKEQ